MAPAAPADRPILRFGDDRLRRVCRPVAAGEADAPALAEELWRQLRRRGGVGLAAPQLGDLRRLIVVKDPRPGPTRRLVLVNPALEPTDAEAVWFEEGCLSFPGLFLRLPRPRAVAVAYRDLAGQEQRLQADGLLARIIQHETDHLDGILFVDHLTGWRRLWLPWRLGRPLGRPPERSPEGPPEERA